MDNGGDFSGWASSVLNMEIIRPGKNLGWTGGLHEGLKHSTSEFVLFMNDDAEFERIDQHFPPHPNNLGLVQLRSNMVGNPEIAAVGPATGTCMGRQSVAGPDIEETGCLVGFCMLVRRSTLDEVGGVLLDWDLGDDIDLCIRIKKYGKRMIIDRRVFVYHHAFKTGVEVFGPAKKPGGWNSIEMVSKTTQRLILKHGAEAVLAALGEEAKPSGVRTVTLDA